MLAYILSLPRSGSTVLTSLLDRRQGVVCMPESSFPQALGEAPTSIRNDPGKLAALYLGASFAGTPLSFDDVLPCMAGDDRTILTAIGRVMASHTGRNPDAVRCVVWKTTRTVSYLRGPLATGGRFIILRRHPLNVFESQFRVPFGESNRHPWRFAMMMQSYEIAFRPIPRKSLMELNYEEIPARMEGLLSFLGLTDEGVWEEGRSSLEDISERRHWHTEILSEFKSDDDVKRTRIAPHVVANLDLALRITRPLRRLFGPLRTLADRKSMKRIQTMAKATLPYA